MTNPIQSTIPTMPTSKPPSRWLRVVLTILPFVIYALASCISLPSSHISGGNGLWNGSPSNNLVALGLFPWILATVFVEIVTRLLRMDHEGASGRAALRRTTNIIGLVCAGVQSAWLIYDLSYLPLAIVDPSMGQVLPHRQISSPILAFGALMFCAIGFKWLVDFVGPRSWLDEHGRALAWPLLLFTLYAITRERSPLDPSAFLDGVDWVRIAVQFFKCGMLLSFLLMKPPFLPPQITDAHKPTHEPVQDARYRRA